MKPLSSGTERLPGSAGEAPGGLQVGALRAAVSGIEARASSAGKARQAGRGGPGAHATTGRCAETAVGGMSAPGLASGDGRLRPGASSEQRGELRALGPTHAVQALARLGPHAVAEHAVAVETAPASTRASAPTMASVSSAPSPMNAPGMTIEDRTTAPAPTTAPDPMTDRSTVASADTHAAGLIASPTSRSPRTPSSRSSWAWRYCAGVPASIQYVSAASANSVRPRPPSPGRSPARSTPCGRRRCGRAPTARGRRCRR